MKKTFEVFLVLIIFYGVYAAFTKAAPIFVERPHQFWLAVSSFIVSALLLVLYSWIIKQSARKNLKETVSQLEKKILEKDQEIRSAQSFKDSVIEEAETTLES